MMPRRGRPSPFEPIAHGVSTFEICVETDYRVPPPIGTQAADRATLRASQPDTVQSRLTVAALAARLLSVHPAVREESPESSSRCRTCVGDGSRCHRLSSS